jgi:D-alanine--poly(phosphoribitol) ligase subunit 1
VFKGRLGAALLTASQRHADRTALRAQGETLNYDQLFHRALGIAAGLREIGVASADRVAVLSHRSATAYASILGVVLAGGTYVPLNTRFPSHRNQAILSASGARALILDAACAADIALVLGDVPQGVAVLTPETPRPQTVTDRIARELADDNEGAADDPAYLMFTSGTTGAPKGVPITHANLAAYLDAIFPVVTLGPDDRVLQSVDLTFDLSVHDLMLTWLNGAALYAVPENAAILAPRLIAQNDITACLIVPSTAAQAAQRGLLTPGSLPSLRFSQFGGEALPVSLARAWGEAAANSRVFNLYGPTEATINFATFEFNPSQVMDYPIVPIGRPLDGQRMAIFDSDGAPLAHGHTGEIYLAGSQLTAGYWRAPHIDAEKFVILHGERWYRTGDLGRLVEPHGYVFAGRADRQVKIRGYRVELQEIEGALREACGREGVAVIAWPVTADGVADGSIAFVAGSDLDTKAALTRCRETLPPYMTPQKIIQIEAFPLNANGKVDYRALADQAAQLA